MNTFILHQVAAQLLSNATVSKVLSNCLIYQQTQLDKLFDICHECQQHNSLGTWIETTWSIIFTTDGPRFSWLKDQSLIYFEDWLKSNSSK